MREAAASVKIGRTLIAWLLWAGACWGQLRGQMTVSVDTTVLQRLDALAKDSVEHVACLYGSASPRGFFVVAYELPSQEPIGTHNVAAADCPTALAHWHHHPVPADSSRERYLYYSMTDQHSFLTTSNAPIAFIGVPGKWCMWTRLQVKEGWDTHQVPLRVIEGQCVSF